MEGHAKRVLAKVEDAKLQIKDEVLRRRDQALEIVEEGAEVSHHDVPEKSKMLPYPVGHCPLSAMPLYPPPSIEKQEGIKFIEIGREVMRCLTKTAATIKSRAISDMDEFSRDEDGDDE